MKNVFRLPYFVALVTLGCHGADLNTSEEDVMVQTPSGAEKRRFVFPKNDRLEDKVDHVGVLQTALGEPVWYGVLPDVFVKTTNGVVGIRFASTLLRMRSSRICPESHLKSEDRYQRLAAAAIKESAPAPFSFRDGELQVRFEPIFGDHALAYGTETSVDGLEEVHLSNIWPISVVTKTSVSKHGILFDLQLGIEKAPATLLLDDELRVREATYRGKPISPLPPIGRDGLSKTDYFIWSSPQKRPVIGFPESEPVRYYVGGSINVLSPDPYRGGGALVYSATRGICWFGPIPEFMAASKTTILFGGSMANGRLWISSSPIGPVPPTSAEIASSVQIGTEALKTERWPRMEIDLTEYMEDQQPFVTDGVTIGSESLQLGINSARGKELKITIGKTGAMTIDSKARGSVELPPDRVRNLFQGTPNFF